MFSKLEKPFTEVKDLIAQYNAVTVYIGKTSRSVANMKNKYGRTQLERSSVNGVHVLETEHHCTAFNSCGPNSPKNVEKNTTYIPSHFIILLKP